MYLELVVILRIRSTWILNLRPQEFMLTAKPMRAQTRGLSPLSPSLCRLSPLLCFVFCLPGSDPNTPHKWVLFLYVLPLAVLSDEPKYSYRGPGYCPLDCGTLSSFSRRPPGGPAHSKARAPPFPPNSSHLQCFQSCSFQHIFNLHHFCSRFTYSKLRWPGT